MKAFRAQKNSFSIDGLSSVGQLEQERAPPESVTYTNGYFHAKYANQAKLACVSQLGRLWAQVSQKINLFQMMRSYWGYEGVALKQRYTSPLVHDLAVLACGLCIGATFALARPQLPQQGWNSSHHALGL